MSAWTSVAIADFAKTSAGGTPNKANKANYEGGTIPWILSGEVGVPLVSHAKSFITEAGLKGSSAKLFPPQTVLVAMYGATAGEVGILGFEAATNQAVCGILPGPKHSPKFLYYYLLLAKPTLVAQAIGNAQPNISQAKIKALEVPLPPLDVQKRIVAVLDQAFAALDRARALAEANLADAEELFENTLDALFERFASSDLILPLGEAVHPDCKLSYGIVQPGDEVAGGLPIVRPVDLGRPIISLAGLKRISPDRADGYSRTKLTGAELLLCVRGTTGEVSMASAELAGANVTRGIVPVRFDPAKVDLEFAYFQMRSPFMRKQIAAKTYGAALMQINIKDVRELRFVRPSLDIQQKAKTKVRQLHDRAERMIGDYQAKLDDLASLRQALLQQAFAGELT